MTFSYQCPFVEINEPDLVFCCLYSIGDARIICRFAVFYILFAEFLYPLYIYIYIYLLLLRYFSHDICSFVYVDMEGHWTLQKRMAVCFQLKMRLPDLIFAALYQYLLVWSTLGRFVSCLHLMFLFLWTHLHGTFLSIFFNCSVWLSNFGNHNPLY